MKLINLKNKKIINTIFSVKKRKLNFVSGFTLIETLVAVFVLTIALSALLSLVSSSIFSARYAHNEFTANYLMQEAVDYIRYDRDTKIQQGLGWGNFLTTYGYYSEDECFSDKGCYLEIEPKTINATIEQCVDDDIFDSETPCQTLNYSDSSSYGYYNYQSNSTRRSNFKRQVKMSMSPDNSNILNVSVNVSWLNGNLSKNRSLNFSLTNWQNQN